MNGKQITLAAIGAVAFLIAAPIACSAYSTAVTTATAPSRVINKTLETNNIIFNYEAFFDLKQKYDVRTVQIVDKQATLARATDPFEVSRLQTELDALKYACRDLATRYNSDSVKINRGIFKSNDLPHTLDMTNCSGE